MYGVIHKLSVQSPTIGDCRAKPKNPDDFSQIKKYILIEIKKRMIAIICLINSRFEEYIVAIKRHTVKITAINPLSNSLSNGSLT